MGDIDLIVGQQTQAAKLVEARISELQKLLTKLSTDIDGVAGGFKGSAANGFGEAIIAWFESTSGLGKQMAEFAGGLYAIDILHGKTDEAVAGVGSDLQTQLERSSAYAARLGG